MSEVNERTCEAFRFLWAIVKGVGLVSMALALSVLASQAQTFSMPSNISKNPGDSFLPQIALDASGNINVVWLDTTPGNNDVFFSRSTDGGKTFSPPLNISNTPVGTYEPQMAVGESGDINVVWDDNDIHSATTNVFFSRSADPGASFSPPRKLSNAQNAGGPIIALDASGNINLAWTEGFAAILFSRSTDGGVTFSPPLAISNGHSEAAPRMAVDESGNIDVICEDDTERTNAFNIFFIRSTDEGKTFSSPLRISNTPGDTFAYYMAVDASGNVNVAWAQANLVPGVNYEFASAARPMEAKPSPHPCKFPRTRQPTRTRRTSPWMRAATST